MPTIKLALDLRGLRMNLKKSLQTAAQLGFTAVELDARQEIPAEGFSETGLRQFRKIMEDLGLKIPAVGFATRRGYHVPQDLERRVEATRKVMRLAASLNAPLVVNQVGQVPEKEDAPGWELLVDVLKDLGAFGLHIGARLTAETGTESGARLRTLLEKLPAGSIPVALNPGNLIINGFSVAEAVEELGSEVVYVRARDGVRDLAQGRGIEVPLGRGVADFPHLVGVLEERGYRGYWTISRREATHPLEEIQQAKQYLETLG